MNPSTTTDAAQVEQSIRERAYLRWLDLGSPMGDDHAHWFWARQQLRVHLENTPAVEAAHFRSPQNSGAPLFGDPTHESHGQRQAHDRRLDVIAGEARQRVRGRHFDASLRAQPKKPQ